MIKWYSLKKYTPITAEYYIVALECGGVSLAYMSGGRWLTCSYDEEINMTVTHFMPLLPVPKDI